MIRVRFAMAPVGNLSIGGARIALANDLVARRGNGRMLLRLDDLDTERSRPAQVDQMMRDLRWLGIDWHCSFRQSERMAVYQAAIDRLIGDRLLYPCFESEQELRAKREFRRKRNQSPIYDRAMLSLTAKQRQDAEAGGKRPHWRLKLSGRTLQWNDLILGARQAVLSAVSDPVLVRSDGSPTPILASVVDDLDFATTDVIRGDDSPGNTAIQIELFEILGGARIPRFGLLGPLHEAAGAMAGRSAGSVLVRGLRHDGVEPCGVAAGLTGITAADGDPLTLNQLAQRLSLADFAACRFDAATMLRINRRVLGRLDFTAVADRLPADATEAFWLAVRGSLDVLKEARGWWDVVNGSIVPPEIEGARDLLLTARSLLPREPWDNTVWANWVAALEPITGLTGDALAAPLRLTLTAEDSGPDLADLLPLIGHSRAAARLAIAAG
ncbi:glutamate--tRNA ligase [Rhodopila sp.]|uniref:glutamate--tRNA ligase n=1 Tax=Rhodopila sp. TaxID=2480087 RepID=UPI003D14531E